MLSSSSSSSSLTMSNNKQRKQRKLNATVVTQRQSRDGSLVKMTHVCRNILFSLLLLHEHIQPVQTSSYSPFTTPRSKVQMAFAQNSPPPYDDGSYTPNPQQKTPQRRRRKVLPLIGPIPNSPPLILGSSITLDPPTPYQWKSLQESVVLHSNFQQRHIQNGVVEEEEDTSAIFAAPLILLIDDVTGSM
eukprot:12977078-Ditylum_brightwellii.AAC.1